MPPLTSPPNFAAFVEEEKSKPTYRRPLAFGICRVNYGQLNADKILSCDFPFINWNQGFGAATVFQYATGLSGQAHNESELVLPISQEFIRLATELLNPFFPEAQGDKHPNAQVIKHLANKTASDLINYKVVFLYGDDPAPKSVPTAYLKLQARSERLAPISTNLSGIFGILPDVAWAGRTPYELDYLRTNKIALMLDGTYPAITRVDKFPLYLDHVAPPPGVRILEGNNVRLGAHLADGTVLMFDGSANFSSAITDKAMIEGAVPSGCTVGNSDIGVGAKIIGILSGGGELPVSIGDNCLLGANAVLGVPLGNRCILDAGTAFLSGTRVAISYEEVEKLKEANPQSDFHLKRHEEQDGLYFFKGIDLSGLNGLHVRVDSLSGTTIVRRSVKIIELNPSLHTAAL